MVSLVQVLRRGDLLTGTWAIQDERILGQVFLDPSGNGPCSGQRSAESRLRSPCVGRRFGPEQHEVLVLVSVNSAADLVTLMASRRRNTCRTLHPGAFPDPSHLGACSSIMAYCRRFDQTVPSELDFAFLADLGYDISSAEGAGEPEYYGFGAWGRYSAWSVGIERLLFDNAPGARDELAATADAFGEAPPIRLADSPLRGAATWDGYLIGVDLGTDSLLPVFGDAALTVNLSTLAGIANFDRLRVHEDGTSRPFRSPSLQYPIAVTGNAFADAGLLLEGSFYGPEHDEMAGVLYDTAPDVNLHAGFGGTRAP